MTRSPSRGDLITHHDHDVVQWITTQPSPFSLTYTQDCCCCLTTRPAQMELGRRLFDGVRLAHCTALFTSDQEGFAVLRKRALRTFLDLRSWLCHFLAYRCIFGQHEGLLCRRSTLKMQRKWTAPSSDPHLVQPRSVGVAGCSAERDNWIWHASSMLRGF